MAVKLRLKRMGAKQRPYYRIVAADSRSPRDGSFIEVVGNYNPILKENNATLDEEKVMKWLSNGAQPTDTVKSILHQSGVWAKYKASAPKKAKKTVKPAKEASETVKSAPAKKTTTKKSEK